MSKPFRKPSKLDVERIVRDEARQSRVRFSAVISACMRPPVIEARKRAVVRIINETGCSERGLAMVWGLDRSTVHRILTKSPPLRVTTPYDQATIDRLRWAHGTARALEIADGRDDAVNQDIAAWRNIGERA